MSYVDGGPGLLNVVVLRVGGDAGEGVDDAVGVPGRAADLLADLTGDGGAGADVELVDHGRPAGDGDLALDAHLQRSVEGLAFAGDGVEGRLSRAEAL